jgi:molybdopterin-binding protein
MRLSARNQIPATVTAITGGEATANIELNAGGVRLVASITVEAARELGLAVGSEVTAVIKASDVIVAVKLSPGDTPRSRAADRPVQAQGAVRPESFPGACEALGWWCRLPRPRRPIGSALGSGL